MYHLLRLHDNPPPPLVSVDPKSTEVSLPVEVLAVGASKDLPLKLSVSN